MNHDHGTSVGQPLRVAIQSDVGNVRINNEDAAGHTWLDDGTLFVVVADGMGGHEAGEVASGLAVQVMEDFVNRSPDQDPRERLYEGLLEANRRILDEGHSSGHRGMGTTAIAAILRGREAFVGLVGDSRLYHIRKGHLVWRTLDHTRVQSLIERGVIVEAEARDHPESGMLTRALGHNRMANGDELVPDVFAEPLTLEDEDVLLMCSDGLHDLVDDWEIGQLVAGREPSDAASALVDLANGRGGHDNVTVAVITVGERAADYDPLFVTERGVAVEATPTDPNPVPWEQSTPLQAEVEVEFTHEAPRAALSLDGAGLTRPRKVLFGLAALSLVVVAGVAVLLAGMAVVAAWFFT